MHACVSLAAVAMVVTSAGGHSHLLLGSGTVLSFVSVGLMVYAYRTFVWRSRQISERRGGPTDDPRGPMLLASGMMLAMAVCLGVVLHKGVW